MHDAVVPPIAYRVVHQDIFAHVHQPEMEDQTSEKARMPGPTSCEPNVRFDESGCGTLECNLPSSALTIFNTLTKKSARRLKI